MSSLALGYVMNLLSRREYSEFELRCKMQEKAFTEEEIEQAIAHCQQKIGKMISVLPKVICTVVHSVAMVCSESNRNCVN